MADADIEVLVAPNPGPMTLEGTNTYLVGRDPVTVIDPGPRHEGHIEAVGAAAAARGGIGTVLVTHSHEDHVGGVELLGVEPTELGEGDSEGGLSCLPTPGHTADSRSFLMGKLLFCGDLILGHGSTIVPPAEQGGSLVDYMASLGRVAELDLELIHPGHGPAITDPAAKIAEYIEHRSSRERRLLAALDDGERSRMALLRRVWDDVPQELLPAAAWAMEAHLEKLEAEGRMPAGGLFE